MLRQAVKVLVAIGVVAGLATSAVATSPTIRCTAAKRRGAGKKIFAKLACYSRGVVQPPVSQSCLLRSEVKFQGVFSRADAQGPCPGGVAETEATVDACVAALRAALPAGDTCGAAKLRATGRAAANEMNCLAKELTKGGAGSCPQTALLKLSTSFSKAGMCLGDVTTVSQVITQQCIEPLKNGVSPTTTVTTTSTSSTSTTSTSLPGGCCGPQRVVTTSAPGSLTLGTFAPFNFPAGVQTVVDVGPPDLTCRHPALVPQGGFDVPPFCIPAIGATSSLESTGCAAGNSDGQGVIWDGGATCNAIVANVTKKGDTSDGICNPAGQPCNAQPGGAGANALGVIDVERTGPCVIAGGVHAQLDIPAHSTTWLSPNGCPDPDGQYDPAVDTLLSEFNFILSPTTDYARASFTDKNNDGCAFVGSGPAGPVTLAGYPIPGPCCQMGQQGYLVAAGAAFSGESTLFDLLFTSSVPITVSSCDQWPGGGSCTLTNNPCLGSASAAFLDD